MNSPLLSVCLITYNHAKYIRQAIDGVLMQKVNFEWELIIADDCSKDDTREILLEYKEKYPDFIKLILQEKNVGAAKNWMDLITSPQSKYIAYFEGDDYWTDENKLQKQVDFLEKKPQYVGCFHNADIIENGIAVARYHDWDTDRDIEPEQIILRGGGIYPTASLVYRNVIKIKEADLKFYAGDTVLLLLLLDKGSFYYMHDNRCAYRKHIHGAFTSLRDNPVNRVDFLVNNILLYKYHRKHLNKRYSNYINDAILVQVRRIYNIYGFYSKESLIMFKHLSFKDIIRLFVFKIKSKYKKKHSKDI